MQTHIQTIHTGSILGNQAHAGLQLAHAWFKIFSRFPSTHESMLTANYNSKLFDCYCNVYHKSFIPCRIDYKARTVERISNRWLYQTYCIYVAIANVDANNKYKHAHDTSTYLRMYVTGFAKIHHIHTQWQRMLFITNR